MRYVSVSVVLAVLAGAACGPGAGSDGARPRPAAAASAESGRSGDKPVSGRTPEPAEREAEPPRPVVAEGTPLVVKLESTVSSARSQAGDTFLGRLSEPIEAGGHVLVPAGAEVRGKVLVAQGSGRVKGRARLAVAFDRLEVEGRKLEIETSSVDVTARSEERRVGR